jgi:hypothetical protein
MFIILINNKHDSNKLLKYERSFAIRETTEYVPNNTDRIGYILQFQRKILKRKVRNTHSNELHNHLTN